MGFRLSVYLVSTALVGSLTCDPSIAYTITLNGYGPSSVTSGASDALGSDSEVLSPVTIPFSRDTSVVVAGSSSNAHFEVSSGGFHSVFDLARTGTNIGTGAAYGEALMSIYFSVDEDVEYAASGTLIATDPDGRMVELIAVLIDFNTFSEVFSSQQTSFATPDEMFTLGVMGADQFDTLRGSLAGTLLADHEYVLSFAARIVAYPSASSVGANASGAFSLSLVPEPTTALLLGVGLVGISIRRRRQARAPTSTLALPSCSLARHGCRQNGSRDTGVRDFS